MGGTEILKPLLQIYAHPVDPMYPRSIFLVTDGDVSNPDAVAK